MLSMLIFIISLLILKRVMQYYNYKSVSSFFYIFLCIHWLCGYSLIYFLYTYLKPKYDFIHFDIQKDFNVLSIISLYGFFLFLLPSVINIKTNNIKNIEIRRNVKPFLFLIFILSVYVGFKINVFGVGLEITSLPLRINGIIEELLTLGISIYLFTIIKNKFYLFLFMVFYGLINLVLYGSKFYSLYPLIIVLVLNIFLANGKNINIKKYLGYTLLFIIFFYSFLNPFKFRTELSNSNSVNFSLISENIISTTNSIIPFKDVIAIGIINIGYRLSGFETITNAQNVINNTNELIIFSPHEKLNLILNNEEGTTSSTGFIGYYQIFFHSIYFGFLFAILILLTIFIILNLKFFRSNFLGELFFLVYLQAFIDGPYFDGLFIKLIFNFLFLTLFFKIKTQNTGV
jgi:hypothetical protein